MATTDADGNVDVSPKGDAAGFVAVEDERTLLIPDRVGTSSSSASRTSSRTPTSASSS
jgi:predicted pyridoxine 5'-phosphate oxidase superfamily flavin-nucleotide-binding protein